MRELSRRALLTRGAGLVAGTAIVPGFVGSLATRAAASGVSGLTLTLPEYPIFPGTTMEEAPALLDQLARKYSKSVGPDSGVSDLVMTRFLFSYVPATLFDRVFAASNPADELPMGEYLWLFHLSGYFGGVWLRAELSRTGHNAALTSFSDPQDEAGFTANVSDADTILDVARGSKRALLEYNEASLFDVENPDDPEAPERGLIDTFGYNEGYLLQIVDAPPEGLTTPPGFVECPAEPADGPLSCDYSVSRLRALRTFSPVAAKLGDGTGAYADLAKEIPPLQAAGIERGRGVWDGLLNVQGFSQEAYEQLLDISSAFLETVQATALATVQASAERTVKVGQKAATSNALLKLWLASYLVGITDGRPGRTLPEFAVA